MLPAPLAEYLEAMARGASCLPPPLLASLHGALRHLEARGALLAAARFIHFGTVPEYPAALAEVIAARLRPFYLAPASRHVTPEVATARALAQHSTWEHPKVFSRHARVSC